VDSKLAGSGPTFQDSFTYHCVHTLIPVYPALDPFLDPFYPRLRYCVVYPSVSLQRPSLVSGGEIPPHSGELQDKEDT
jgi:hypothetical protein